MVHMKLNLKGIATLGGSHVVCRQFQRRSTTLAVGPSHLQSYNLSTIYGVLLLLFNLQDNIKRKTSDQPVPP